MGLGLLGRAMKAFADLFLERRNHCFAIESTDYEQDLFIQGFIFATIDA